MKMKFDSVIAKILRLFQTPWISKSFPVLSFLKSKCRSTMVNENLESELKGVVSVKDKLGV